MQHPCLIIDANTKLSIQAIMSRGKLYHSSQQREKHKSVDDRVYCRSKTTPMFSLVCVKIISFCKSMKQSLSDISMRPEKLISIRNRNQIIHNEEHKLCMSKTHV